MKFIRALVASFIACALFSCALDKNPSSTGEKPIPGSATVTIGISPVGSLGKRDIQMDKLYIELTNPTEPAIYDTFLLSENGQQTITKLYTKLASLDQWTLSVQSLDKNGVIIHQGDTLFVVPTGDRINITLNLKARYSMLVANFFPIYDSVMKCEVKVDGAVVVDSAFAKQTLIGDTVRLKFDYLTTMALSNRIIHGVEMNVYGEIRDSIFLLYSGSKNISVLPGQNIVHNISLDWVGPPPGRLGMTVILGAVGTQTTNGNLIPKYSTVLFNSQGATVPANPISKTVIPPATTIDALPTPPTKTGYIFGGWYTEPDGAGTEFTASTVVTASITVYAKWSAGVTDIDGNIYTTVTIGTQTWMVENLKTTRYNDGTEIPLVTDNGLWSALSTPGYCWYNNDMANNENYGALYNWYAVKTGKLAPTGWHVPTDAELTILENYLIASGYNWDGTTSGNKIAKSMAAKADWSTSILPGSIGNDLTKNNNSGFSALPGGARHFRDGKFYYQSELGFWWSSTEAGPKIAYYRFLCWEYENLVRVNDDGGGCGFSVRLLRD